VLTSIPHRQTNRGKPVTGKRELLKIFTVKVQKHERCGPPAVWVRTGKGVHFISGLAGSRTAAAYRREVKRAGAKRCFVPAMLSASGGTNAVLQRG
jgi:hypothetical protein